jgi:hypothetical protein
LLKNFSIAAIRHRQTGATCILRYPYFAQVVGERCAYIDVTSIKQLAIRRTHGMLSFSAATVERILDWFCERVIDVAGTHAEPVVQAGPVREDLLSLYGVGFYYVPGTDMCLKIGGWVRAVA